MHFLYGIVDTEFKIMHSISAKPSWVNDPLDVEAGVEEEAHFSCMAKGKPEPKVEWFINGIAIAG